MSRTATDWHLLHRGDDFCEECLRAMSAIDMVEYDLEESLDQETWDALPADNDIEAWRETNESADDVFEFRLRNGRTLRVEGSFDVDGYGATGARFL